MGCAICSRQSALSLARCFYSKYADHMNSFCHCRSGKPFSDCCEPFLRGVSVPPTAEELMRSRFSAFCEGMAEYLVQTHHPNNRSGNDHAEIEQTIKTTEWMNLIILSKTKGGARDEEGHVEFAAAFKSKPINLLVGNANTASELTQLHERSLFIREDGRWLYVDGDRLPAHQPKRNEPCWCGSEKKTKACHG